MPGPLHPYFSNFLFIHLISSFNMSGFRLASDFSQVFVWLPPFESADFAFLTDSGKLEYERKTLTL